MIVVVSGMASIAATEKYKETSSPLLKPAKQCGQEVTLLEPYIMFNANTSTTVSWIPFF